jgi:hypothetical protein
LEFEASQGEESLKDDSIDLVLFDCKGVMVEEFLVLGKPEAEPVNVNV